MTVLPEWVNKIRETPCLDPTETCCRCEDIGNLVEALELALEAFEKADDIMLNDTIVQIHALGEEGQVKEEPKIAINPQCDLCNGTGYFKDVLCLACIPYGSLAREKLDKPRE